MILSLLSVLSLSPLDVYGAEDTVKYSCAELGYTTPYEECIAVEGAVPLLCPFYSLSDNHGNTVDNKMTLCMIRSCRGYHLTDADLNAQASDKRTIRDHVKELDSCTVGGGNDKFTYYKIVECKEGSLYQNDICDVGCLSARYPYDLHPGDAAGDVVECVDSVGHWFGYADCNDGWNGGWKDTSSTANPTGKCEFASCDLKDYPYMRDPNISLVGENVNRGATSFCSIGANRYYRYTSVDKDGNPLTDNVCGRGEHSAYTLSLGVCKKQCHFSNCVKVVKEETRHGYTFSYNEFTCTQDTKDCRVGDVAIYDGVEMGYIVHLPNDSSDRLLIVNSQLVNSQWSSGDYYNTNTPIQDGIDGGDYGKCNGKLLLKYKEVENAKEGYVKYIYPVFEGMNIFAPSGCENIPVCTQGEWYVPTYSEVSKFYSDRYVISSSSGSRDILTLSVGLANEQTSLYSYRFVFDATGSNGIYDSFTKNVNKYFFRMLSFYVR